MVSDAAPFSLVVFINILNSRIENQASECKKSLMQSPRKPRQQAIYNVRMHCRHRFTAGAKVRQAHADKDSRICH
jgi:hypothetical protein